jgi:hypothetical protein
MELSNVHTTRQITVATFVAMAVLGPILWMAMDRTPPYTFKKVEIAPDPAVQGGEIYITFTAKQNRPACGPGLVYREFREANGKLHLFDPVMRAEAPELGPDRKFTRIATLPEAVSPGPTTYRGQSCYTCNPLHSWLRWPVCAATPEANFNVVRKPEGPP